MRDSLKTPPSSPSWDGFPPRPTEYEPRRFGAPGTVLADPKHFIGDGGTVWRTGSPLLDQGDDQMDEAALRRLFLPPYAEAIKNGARCIMISFSSFSGVKMHANKHLLTDVLKGELHFSGFLVSDWKAIDQLQGDLYSDVVTSINAGLDMIMTPYDSQSFCAALAKAVDAKTSRSRGSTTPSAYFESQVRARLFERPFADRDLLPQVGSAEHRVLAREAVRKSLVLLKNEATLPFPNNSRSFSSPGPTGGQPGRPVAAAGRSNGRAGPGRSLTARPSSRHPIARERKTAVQYSPNGDFGKAVKTAAGIVVVGESPTPRAAETRPICRFRRPDRTGQAYAPVLRQARRDRDLRAAGHRHRSPPFVDAVVRPGSLERRARVWPTSFSGFPVHGKAVLHLAESMAGVPLEKAIEVRYCFRTDTG